MLSGYRFIVILILSWSMLVYLSFYWNISNHEKHSIRLATIQANDFWNKDNAFRDWATRHGGVYVKPDKRTPPNPLLAHLPDRDIETKKGVKLTLMNPAYMMRQMTEEFEDTYGVKGKITGQKLLDPEGKRNKADPWEMNALQQFDRGKKEVIEVTKIKGKLYLRLMRPIRMKKGCVRCHGHLGFKVGDIRGGVSVSVPLKPFNAANESTGRQAMFIHLAIFLIGVTAVLYVFSIKQSEIKRKKTSDEMIRRSQKLDALGQLTGGVAHDFNNVLGVITGYAQLLESMLDDNAKLAGYAREIHRAGERGAKLTSRLLSFSRKKSTDAELNDINALLRDEQHMLEKTLTARIQLEFDLEDNLGLVWLDKGDLENALINIRARDKIT